MKERTASVKKLDGGKLPVYLVTFNDVFGTVGQWPCDAAQVGELVLNWLNFGKRPQ